MVVYQLICYAARNSNSLTHLCSKLKHTAFKHLIKLILLPYIVISVTPSHFTDKKKADKIQSFLHTF